MGFYANSATAASNTTVNSIASAGSSDPANIDNLIRELAAQGRQFANDLGGSNTVAGTADAITITLSSGSPGAYYDGFIFGFIAGGDTTITGPTANVSSLGAKTIKKAVFGTETALEIGDIQSGGLYMLRYRSSWAAAAGAFQLIDLNGIDFLKYAGANVGYVVGLYYVAGAGIPGSSTATLTANKLYAAPITITYPVTIAAVVAEVSTGAVGNIRMGIYKNVFSTGKPGALVVDIGTATTNAAAVKEIASTQYLEPGKYWIALVCDIAAVMSRLSASNLNVSLQAIGATAFTLTASTDMPAGCSADHTYAALPAAYPSVNFAWLDASSFPKIGIKA